MASGIIKNPRLSIVYARVYGSIQPNSYYSTNLKSVIDQVIPQGSHYVSIAEYALNDQHIILTNMYYDDVDYSLFVRNLSNETVQLNIVIGVLVATD